MADKDTKDFEKIVEEGEAWLIKYGYISPQAHNRIIVTLHERFPFIKNVEYFVKSEDEKEIQLIVYVSFWRFLLRSMKKLIRQIEEVMFEFFSEEYQVGVIVKVGRDETS